MKVFIGGSRKISRLNDSLRKRIEQMIQKNLQILLGAANGADKAVTDREFSAVTTTGDCGNSRWTATLCVQV